MEAAQAARVLGASTGVVTAILAGDEPDEVLRLAVRTAAELVAADLALVMAPGPDRVLTVEAAHHARGTSVGDFIGVRLHSQSAPAGAVAANVPIMAETVAGDCHAPDPLRDYGPFLVTPFGNSAHGLGALGAYRNRETRPFEQADAEVLTAFAGQVAVVLMLAEGAHASQQVALYQQRERIARDLHDVIVQQLYATGMRLDLLARELPDRQAETLGEAVTALDATIDEIRAAVRKLRVADLAETEPVALFDRVRAEVAKATDLLGLSPELRLSGDTEMVPSEVADHAKAALREALSNVVRHARAGKVEVLVHIGGDQLLLRVRDDGNGIPHGVNRRGLAHLEERATEAGGWCSVRSTPGRGTTVTWTVPI